MDFKSSMEVVLHAKDTSLLAAMITQLKKDFTLANHPLTFGSACSYAEYIATVKEKVYFLMMEKFDDYLTLLYVIDVPEKEFKKIKVTDAVAVSEAVTFLVLKREYQKVWLRQKYS